MELEAGKDYQRIQIFLSGRDVRDLDFFSKSDPYIKVSYRKDYTHQEFYQLGRTETQKNQLNPDFSKTFVLDFIFESRQDIKFELWDDDGGRKDEFIGSVTTTIGNLMGAPSQTTALELMSSEKRGKSAGSVIIRCEKVQDSNQFMTFRFRAEKLMNTDSFFDFWDKSDPYIKMMKIRDDNSLIENNLNPAWLPFEIQGNRLINPYKQCFKVEVWDHDADDPHEFMGQIFLNLHDLKKGMRMPLQNVNKKKAGFLILQDYNRVVIPGFIDYLRGGLQLNMTVAIDFTASNGITCNPQSLHYIEDDKPNQYQIAIMAISEILLNYDTNKQIAAVGFGSKPKYAQLNEESVSHCFPISGRKNNIQASGMVQLLQWYKNALSNMELSGPTYFGPVLEQAMKIAHQSRAKGSNVYQTLLILTDGSIHDMQITIDLLIQAAQLPLSLIIVGVGQADFTKMKKLDGDGGLSNSKGVRCPRDIVQFVPFRDLQLDGNLLARQLLAELPNQVLQYMKMIGKQPGEYIPISYSQLVPQKAQ